MDNRRDWLIFAAVLIAIAAGVFVWQRRPAEAPVRASAVPAQSAPKHAAGSAPSIQFPVGQSPDPSLPSLEQSDTAMRALLASLFGRNVFEEYFSPQQIIVRIVATVDNLAREKAAQRLMPVKPASGHPVLAGQGETRTLAAANAARYRPYVAMLDSVAPAKLAAAYVRFYPLFQQAYRDLGYPSGYFNDRLIEVIDHLLAAPELKGPAGLVQRKVLYEFADPELEARSAGQKILIRIGPENAAKTKAWLREFRRQLTTQPRPS